MEAHSPAVWKNNMILFYEAPRGQNNPVKLPYLVSQDPLILSQYSELVQVKIQ